MAIDVLLSESVSAIGIGWNYDTDAGVQDGDLEVVGIFLSSSVTITPPADWSTVIDSTGSSSRLGIYTRRYTTGDTSPSLFNFSANANMVGMGSLVRGLDPAETFDVSPVLAFGTGSTLTASSVSAVASDATLVTYHFGATNGGTNSTTTLSVPTGMTQVDMERGGGSRFGLTCYEDLASSGATGTRSSTCSVSTISYGTATFTVAPEATATEVTGTAAAPLGGLTATASGDSFTPVTGTAAAPLGALTASASGTRAVLGAAAAPLGALTAAATGTVAVTGAAAAPLGELAATATDRKSVV